MARHTYLCPLRWADLDQLGHVNNVTYVDYLQEARVDMLSVHAAIRGGEELAEGVVVVRHEVDFVAPLLFRPEPVRIDTWVSRVRAASFVLSYEIYDEAPDGTRTVYLRARSVMAPYVFATEAPRRLTEDEREALSRMTDSEGDEVRPRSGRVSRDPGGAALHHYDCHVRFSDVDLYRHVNNVKYFEYFQEARIVLFSGLERPEGARVPSVVVAALDVDYEAPVLLASQPYPVTSWVSRQGTSSVEITSQLAAPDGAVLSRARATLVTFDPVTQRAAPAPDWFQRSLRGT